MKSKLIYAFVLFAFFSKLSFASDTHSLRREKVETFVGVVHMMKVGTQTQVILVVSEKEAYKLHIASHLRGVTLNNMNKRVEVKGVRVKEESDSLFPMIKVKNLVRKVN